MRQHEVDVGQRPCLSSDEREELKRLRRENPVLREEREERAILRRAASSSPGERLRRAGNQQVSRDQWRPGGIDFIAVVVGVLELNRYVIDYVWSWARAPD